jgi:tetratricopeptide (TPR) repeat protein
VFDASLSTAFGIGLAQSTHANVLSRARLDESLRRMGRKDKPRIDETLGREIGIRESVRGLVVPAIGRIGSQYTLSARLIDPHTGVQVRSYLEHAADANAVLDALGRIGDAIRRDLGESLPSIRADSRPLPLVTTASLEALQNYAAGQELWWQGKYPEAVVQYERAIGHDPDFAMAHAALGNAYLSFIYNDEVLGKKHLDGALALADRTTERERMYLQAAYEARLGDRQFAITLYETYLFRYPDDEGVRHNLANLLRELRRFEEAVVQYQEVIRVAPANASALINLATVQANLGRYDESLATYQRAFDIEPTWKGGSNLNHEYGMVLVRAGRAVEARAVFALTLGTPPERPRGLRSLALVDVYEGRYQRALPQFAEAVRLNDSLQRTLSAGRDWFFLASTYETLGDRRRHLDALKQATTDYEASRALGFLTRAGVAWARAGQLAEAERVLAVVRTMPTNPDASYPSEVARLEGEVHVARGRLAEGIERLQWADVQQGAMPALTKPALARAYERAGRLDHAVAAYEALLDTDAFGWEPQQDWLDAHYRLAALYAKRGDTDRARTLLDRFLTLWKDADAGVPLLDGARRLRAELP